MNLINFEEKACERVRKFLDAYLSNELSAETKAETRRHLDRCARCAGEVETRRGIKAALKLAFDRDAPAPAELRGNILDRLNPQPVRTDWGRWLMAVAATVLLAAGGVGIWSWLAARRVSEGALQAPASARDNNLISAKSLEAFNVGLGDHIHCALHRDYSSGPRSFERMSSDLGPDYIGLVSLVKEHAPRDYTVMVGHRCEFKGRQFVHLILTGRMNVVSVILTKKNGAGFDERASSTAPREAGAPLYRARLQEQEIVGFETRDYLAYVVSGLPRDDHFHLAVDLAPSVRNFLARLEV